LIQAASHRGILFIFLSRPVKIALFGYQDIDDASLRNYVQRALNRGEAYHQLRRAISNVNGDRFRGNSDKEIQLWNECARLVANAIIYFNSKVLSRLLIALSDNVIYKELRL
jgi:TnpA family transposase